MDLLASEARAMVGWFAGKQLVTVAKKETETAEDSARMTEMGSKLKGGRLKWVLVKGARHWLHAWMGPGRGCREVEEGCR